MCTLPMMTLSVGSILSRIWRDRLGVATGAALMLVNLWLFLICATDVVVLHI